MFGKASRDAHQMGCLETAKLPDYVKLPGNSGISRSASKSSTIGGQTTDVNQSNSRRQSCDTATATSKKPGLPKNLPLQREHEYRRSSKLSASVMDKHNREMIGKSGNLVVGSSSGSFIYPSTCSHPLEQPSGRNITSKTYPDAQKITQKMVDAEEHAGIVALNRNERALNRQSGRGLSDSHFLGKHAM